jgi:hypothetical protein
MDPRFLLTMERQRRQELHTLHTRAARRRLAPTEAPRGTRRAARSGGGSGRRLPFRRPRAA